jgi:hypothetical protein
MFGKSQIWDYDVAHAAVDYSHCGQVVRERNVFLFFSNTLSINKRAEASVLQRQSSAKQQFYKSQLVFMHREINEVRRVKRMNSGVESSRVLKSGHDGFCSQKTPILIAVKFYSYVTFRSS